jgi:hypothetical protein
MKQILFIAVLAFVTFPARAEKVVAEVKYVCAGQDDLGKIKAELILQTKQFGDQLVRLVPQLDLELGSERLTVEEDRLDANVRESIFGNEVTARERDTNIYHDRSYVLLLPTFVPTESGASPQSFEGVFSFVEIIRSPPRHERVNQHIRRLAKVFCSGKMSLK